MPGPYVLSAAPYPIPGAGKAGDSMFERKDLVFIDRVDMFGFTGRDYHPTRADEGLLAEVVGVLVGALEPDGEGPEEGLCVLKCLTHGPDPKFLELMPHEVDLVLVVRTQSFR